MSVRRTVIDLGFCIAVIHPNHSPEDSETHGAIVLQITQPESDSEGAKTIELWHHEGLINLRDALSTAIAEREEEVFLEMKRRGEDPDEMLKELDQDH